MIGLRTARRRQRAIASERGFRFSVQGGSGAPGEARNRVADGLDGVLDDAVLDTRRLLVSEVATNCVQHAQADTRTQIDVAVLLRAGAVRVELSAPGSPFERPSIKPARPEPGDGRGRGLFIVDTLAQDWGVGPRAGNRVWFELATR